MGKEGEGSEPIGEEVTALARKFALQNAVQYDGSCEMGPVMARVLGEKAEWRSYAKVVSSIVKDEVADVNAMTVEAQLEELESIDPTMVERQVKEREKGLPDLENVNGEVVMRFAPGPSGPLHVGHSRAAILNDEYVKRYGGRYILRLEDTDPARVMPEAYSMIRQDMEWLGCEVHEVYDQTDRFDLYYDHARKLLEMEAAFVCTCPQEQLRQLRAVGKACPHRDVVSAVHLDLWDKMLAREIGPGEASVVVKTELSDPNPALRDFVALRISSEPHPKTEDRYWVYPLYNFSVAIDDHMMGMTHVLRGKDHLNNTLRQMWVYKYFNWVPPQFHHYGFVSIADTVLKTSHIKSSMADGKYSGWDDPRLGTLRALGRRGLSPEALRRYWVDASIRPIEIKFSWKTMFAHDRDIHEADSPRLFFVANPVELVVASTEPLVGHAPVHPDRPELGNREVALPANDEGGYRVLVPMDDLTRISAVRRFRLKDLGNFEFTGPREIAYVGDDLAIVKEGAPIVHWTTPEGVDTLVRNPDGTEDAGIVEPMALELDGQFVQFERYGFTRLEVDADTPAVTAFFAYR
jgi:glutamyl-tRNA synthetase